MAQSEERQSLLRFIQVMDKPLLGLAVAAVTLYMVFLFGVFDGAPRVYTAISLVIDLIFVADLCLKFIAFGRSYLLTPWCLIDALSCVPIVDTVGAGLDGLGAIRFVRALRMFRILRTLRVLRILRSLPVFDRIVSQAHHGASAARFGRALAGGVAVYSILFLLLVVQTHRHAEHYFEEEMRRALQAGAELQSLGGYLAPPSEHALQVTVDGVDYYFSHHNVDEYARTSELYLLLGTVVTMTLFLFLLNFQLRDVSYGQLHGLLNVALPRQVVAEFMRRPTSYTEKSRDCATILFMDFVGFTRTCETFNGDIYLLAHNLEEAMDCVVAELNRYDLIIDKFIGDAIMCFRGGPLVEGTAEEHAYRSVRAALAANRVLGQLQNPYFFKLKIGGASASHCLIGAFGTSTRLSYTTLGDGVNLAARLEPASGQCQTDNLFCSTTYELCAGRSDLAWRRWGQIRVPGKSQPEHVYEAFDATTLTDRTFLDEFAQGLHQFENRNFSQAREHFVRADQIRDGGDRASRHYIEWCDDLLSCPLSEDWEPVLRTKK